MNSYPADRSVLVLDNCPIHRQERLIEEATRRGIIVLFLEPYDPDSMPVECAYKCMKNFLRTHGKMLDEMGYDLPAKLRISMRSLGCGDSRHCFHASGF